MAKNCQCTTEPCDSCVQELEETIDVQWESDFPDLLPYEEDGEEQCEAQANAMGIEEEDAPPPTLRLYHGQGRPEDAPPPTLAGDMTQEQFIEILRSI